MYKYIWKLVFKGVWRSWLQIWCQEVKIQNGGYNNVADKIEKKMEYEKKITVCGFRVFYVSDYKFDMELVQNDGSKIVDWNANHLKKLFLS